MLARRQQSRTARAGRLTQTRWRGRPNDSRSCIQRKIGHQGREQGQQKNDARNSPWDAQLGCGGVSMESNCRHGGCQEDYQLNVRDYYSAFTGNVWVDQEYLLPDQQSWPTQLSRSSRSSSNALSVGNRKGARAKSSAAQAGPARSVICCLECNPLAGAHCRIHR